MCNFAHSALPQFTHRHAYVTVYYAMYVNGTFSCCNCSLAECLPKTTLAPKRRAYRRDLQRDLNSSKDAFYISLRLGFSPTESLTERRLFEERVYPELRTHCAAHGCQLRVLDLSRGLRDEYACRQELVRLRQRLQGNFRNQRTPCIFTVSTLFCSVPLSSSSPVGHKITTTLSRLHFSGRYKISD